MKAKKLATGILLCLLSGIFPTTQAFDFSQIEERVVEFTLDNGLKFVVLPDNEAPVVHIRTVVKIGGANDPKGAAGLAHMFEHMAFKGTTEIGTDNLELELKWMAVEDSLFGLILEEKAKMERSDSTRLAELQEQLRIATDSATSYVVTNEYANIYKSNGGVEMNAGTGYDRTFYVTNYPANRLELWMATESQRFTQPVLREFYKEKEVIAEERRSSREVSPFGKLRDELLAAAYVAHPYSRSLIGSMSEIKNFYRPEALAYYEEYYVPGNMVIGIVGDVKPKEVKKLAQKYFEHIPARPIPKPVMIVEAPQTAERKVVVKDKAQPIYFAAFHIPSANHPDFLALEALADYLGQGRTSLLYKKLVKEMKIATNTVSFAGTPADYYPCLFGVVAVPSKDHTNKEADTEIVKIIEDLKSEPIPKDELEKIKARAKASFVNQLAQNSGFTGMASALPTYELLYGGWRELFRYVDKINALTSEDIQRVAKEYLDITKRTVAFLEPEDE
jgi:predicted Zn-dependent peptidase